MTRPWLAMTRMPALAGSAQRSTARARAVARRKTSGVLTWNIFWTSAPRPVSTPNVRRDPRREQVARFENLTLILYNGREFLVLRNSCEFLMASLPDNSQSPEAVRVLAP